MRARRAASRRRDAVEELLQPVEARLLLGRQRRHGGRGNPLVREIERQAADADDGGGEHERAGRLAPRHPHRHEPPDVERRHARGRAAHEDVEPG